MPLWDPFQTFNGLLSCLKFQIYYDHSTTNDNGRYYRLFHSERKSLNVFLKSIETLLDWEFNNFKSWTGFCSVFGLIQKIDLEKQASLQEC